MSKTPQHRHHSIIPVYIFFLSVAAFLLVNCASGTSPTTLPVDSTDSFSDSGTEAVPDEWWTEFQDRSLNALVDSALTSNLTLKSAWQRLQAARAVVDRETSFLIPDLSGSFEGEINQPNSDAEAAQTLSLGLTADYELDLWGRIRSNIQAEQFRADATMADYQTAALTLTAEVVRTWFQVIEARSQLALARDQVETNEKVLDLIKARFGSGQIRSADILRQRQLLESTREQSYLAESRLTILEHQFTVLLGESPRHETGYAENGLPELPPLPDTGIPMELIQRRPDVQSAHNRLRAADKDMAAAVSNQYPRLSLTASVSSTAENAENLFEDWAQAFAGNLFAPLIYGGQLRAEVDRAEAVRQQRVFDYGQTVLVAFREVEDALVREQQQLQSIQSLEIQVNLARQTYEQLRIEYFNGLGDYLDVLTALDQEQQLRRDLLSARLHLLEYRIALYRALAGGIETDRETGT